MRLTRTATTLVLDGTWIMCELLGISSSRPLSPQVLLDAFRRRGGEIADNPDGWGVAYLHDGRFALHKEPIPAAHSQRFIELAASVRSELVIGHVRKARMPRVNTTTNTHPFLHNCCGREWVFAHNGLVPEVISPPHHASHLPCTPDGETDSEHAFCQLLGDISRHFHEPSATGLEPWVEALAVLSGEIAAHGKFNFLVSDGIHLIAYGHDRLHYHVRRTGGVTHEVWISTEPLIAEPWQPFEANELRIYRQGRLIGRVLTPRERAPAAVTNTRSMNAA